jgi:hypothetical protein
MLKNQMTTLLADEPAVEVRLVTVSPMSTIPRSDRGSLNPDDAAACLRSLSVASGDALANRARLRTVPLTLVQANALVTKLHRHHHPARGHRFSLGAFTDGRLIGAAIIGRPVARGCHPYWTAEVTRLVTDGTPNACSHLYGAAARVAREMGFAKIQTYILDSEPGTSLRAAGWTLEATTSGGDWNHSARNKGTRRTDQPMTPKQRWAKLLAANEPMVDLPDAA